MKKYFSKFFSLSHIYECLVLPEQSGTIWINKNRERSDCCFIDILGFYGASRPSSISIICEHFLFVYIVKTKANIKVCGFSKQFCWFSKFNGNQFCWRLTFEILIIHKPSLGTCKVPHKFGPDRFRRLDVYWIQTNKHPFACSRLPGPVVSW